MSFRQFKTRQICADLETTVGTFKLASSANPIWPCRGASTIKPGPDEEISNDDALDGYAGSIAATRGAVGMTGQIDCEIRDYTGSLVYPPWVRMLHASGMGSTHAGSTVTMTPSTKAIADWPGESAGTRSPATLSLAEVLLDNNTADELVKLRGASLASKLILNTSGLALVSGVPHGLVVGSEFLDPDDVDLSDYGTRTSGEAVDPLVVKGATLAVNYVDALGSTDISAAVKRKWRQFEIDIAPTIALEEDPTATEGYSPGQPFHEGGHPVTLSFADTSTIAEDIMAGFYSKRGFLDIVLTLEMSTCTMVVDVPFVQYKADREAADGGRIFSIQGVARRQNAGDSTAPLTVSHTYA